MVLAFVISCFRETFALFIRLGTLKFLDERDYYESLTKFFMRDEIHTVKLITLPEEYSCSLVAVSFFHYDKSEGILMLFITDGQNVCSRLIAATKNSDERLCGYK